jgi:hypothetical protein
MKVLICCFKTLIKISEEEVMSLLQIEPTGQYSRKIWFYNEWLLQTELPIADLAIKNYVPLLEEKVQYSVTGIKSSRHKITNNLPGTVDFAL